LNEIVRYAYQAGIKLTANNGVNFNSVSDDILETLVKLYAIPLCRNTDAEAEAELAAMVDAIGPAIVARRIEKTSGARGMWASEDKLSFLDTNEGFASASSGVPTPSSNVCANFTPSASIASISRCTISFSIAKFFPP